MPGMHDIEHIILLMMENRSFDHYLGALTLEGRRDVDGIADPDTMANPSDEVGQISMFQLDSPGSETDMSDRAFRDPPHDRDQVLDQINGGAMDGFVRSYERYHRRRRRDPAGRARNVMGFYTRHTLGVLYALADEFAVCNRWFSSFAGSTWPNRVYAFAGDADELTGTGMDWISRWNAFRYPDPPFVKAWGRDMERSWKAYSPRPEQNSTFALWRVGPVYRGKRGGSIEDFAADCHSQRLPRICILEPDYSISDDHPPHDPRRGQQLMSRVVKALLSSPSWHRSVLIITYDEHGGFFDHVPPPVSPEGRPDPHDVLGVRVPTVVLSPYTRKGIALNELFDHTTFLKSIAERWGLSVPGPRASSSAIRSLWNSNCFDWTMAPRSGSEILARIPEPGFTLDRRDFIAAATAKPTDLESQLRNLNLARELESLL